MSRGPKRAGRTQALARGTDPLARCANQARKRLDPGMQEQSTGHARKLVRSSQDQGNLAWQGESLHSQ